MLSFKFQNIRKCCLSKFETSYMLSFKIQYSKISVKILTFLGYNVSTLQDTKIPTSLTLQKILKMLSFKIQNFKNAVFQNSILQDICLISNLSRLQCLYFARDQNSNKSNIAKIPKMLSFKIQSIKKMLSFKFKTSEMLSFKILYSRISVKILTFLGYNVSVLQDIKIPTSLTLKNSKYAVFQNSKLQKCCLSIFNTPKYLSNF
jgi:hypothetical protein